MLVTRDLQIINQVYLTNARKLQSLFKINQVPKYFQFFQYIFSTDIDKNKGWPNHCGKIKQSHVMF